MAYPKVCVLDPYHNFGAEFVEMTHKFIDDRIELLTLFFQIQHTRPERRVVGNAQGPGAPGTWERHEILSFCNQVMDIITNSSLDSFHNKVGDVHGNSHYFLVRPW